MAVKKIHWLIPALGITYAAGWFSHWPPAVETVRNQQLVTMTATPPGGGMTGPDAAGDRTTLDPSREIRPFTSLAEILELLDGIEDGPEELAVLEAADLLPRLMVTDGVTVRRLLGELMGGQALDPDSDLFPMVGGGLLFRGMMLQPEATAALVVSHFDKMEDLDGIAPFVVAWAARSDPSAGERLLAMMPEENREDAGELLEQLKISKDPAAALRDPAVLENLDSSDIRQLASRWMKSDASAMLAWRATLPEGETRSSVDSAVLDSVIKDDTDTATAESRLGTLPPDLAAQGRLRLLSKDIHGVFSKEPFLEGDLRQSVNPADYTSRLSQLLALSPASPGSPSSREAETTVRALSTIYSEQEKFAEGIAWSATLPEGIIRETAVSGLINSWLDTDTSSASAWIDTLPVGSLRDMAARRLIGKIQTDDPVNALVWARALSEESKRRDAINDVYRSWFASDPVAASQAVQNLSAGDQQLLQSGKETAELDPFQTPIRVKKNMTVQEPAEASQGEQARETQTPPQPVPTEGNAPNEEDNAPPAEEAMEE